MLVVPKELLDLALGTNPLSDERAEEVSELQRHWIIVDDEADELALWNAWMGQYQFNNPVIELYLYLTTACNLGCSYCFQGTNKPTIPLSPETLNRMVEYVESLIQKQTVQELSVTFFGGEPMANKPILISAMETLVARLGQKLAITFSIITNGTLFQGEAEARALAEKGLKFVQITLDGPREIHDQRRMYLGGQGSFDTILKNVELIAPHLQVSVRVNIDHENRAHVRELIDQLASRGLQGRVSFSFAWVYFDQRQEDYHAELLSQAEAAHICDDLINYALDRGFASKIGYDGPCMIHMMNSLVLYPSGDLYHCPNLTGHQAFVWGNVNTGINELKKALIPGIRTWDDCGDCALLPICGGGCVAHSYNQTGKLGRHCEYKRLETSVRLDMQRTWRHTLEGREAPVPVSPKGC